MVAMTSSPAESDELASRHAASVLRQYSDGRPSLRAHSRRYQGCISTEAFPKVADQRVPVRAGFSSRHVSFAGVGSWVGLRPE